MRLVLMVLLVAAARLAVAGNLVSDGGFETVKTINLAADPYLRKLVEDGCDFGSGKDFATIPTAFSQGCGKFALEVLEGVPGQEVRSGKRAIRLRGGFYLQGAFPDAYLAREGDIFKARYFAKGKGRSQVNYALYGEGVKRCLPMGRKGTVTPDAWSPQEETCMMVGSGLGSVFPWLSVDGDVSVDDLSIEKVSSQAEPQPLRRVAPYEFAKATCAFPAARPPVIDGKLDDPCWKDVPAAGAFLTYGDERSEASPPTTFKAVFDQHALYLAVSCAEPGMAGLVNPAQGVDTGTEQYVGVNSLEIFLDPGRTRAHCYQFVVAADGREYDGEGKDAKWHVQWLASPSVGADGWTLELAIPYASLGVGAPRTGDTWGLNVCRNRGPYDSNATWSPVGEVFHTPALFGALVFGSYRQWHEEVFVKGRQALEARLRQRPGGAEGLERIERFAARLDETVKKDGLPADWRTFSRLHYQAAFVMDALENLERHQRWAELLEAKGMDDKNINTR